MTKPLHGLIPDQTIEHIDSFTLESGTVLENVPVAFKTWGTLNEDGSNVMVICHALSGSADVEDWWGPLLGPGRAFDPDVFFIFCGNVLGSPYGTASPLTTDPKTGKPYGPTFPITSVRDDVRLHNEILTRLGVKVIQAVIGGSMGGMQVLEWSFFGSDYVKSIVPLATSGRHSAWCIAWGESQRQTIYSDPNYGNGYYSADSAPTNGLAAARMQALLTYRSRNSFESRFGRKVMPGANPSSSPQPAPTATAYHNEGNKSNPHSPNGKKSSSAEAIASDTTETERTSDTTSPPKVFSAQSYLRYQGDKFIKRFDANCYISITRKMDTHDVSRGRGEYFDVLARVEQPTLVIGIETDGLFTIGEQRELAESIPNATLAVIASPEGHDGFLLEFEQINRLISDFIRVNVAHLFEGAGEGKVKVGGKDAFVAAKPSVFGEAEDALLW